MVTGYSTVPPFMKNPCPPLPSIRKFYRTLPHSKLPRPSSISKPETVVITTEQAYFSSPVQPYTTLQPYKVNNEERRKRKSICPSTAINHERPQRGHAKCSTARNKQTRSRMRVQLQINHAQLQRSWQSDQRKETRLCVRPGRCTGGSVGNKTKTKPFHKYPLS